MDGPQHKAPGACSRQTAGRPNRLLVSFLACVFLQVAFNFVPSRQAFMEKVAGKDDPEAVKDMQAFIDAFSPVLAEAHKFLVGCWAAGLAGGGGGRGGLLELSF